MNARHAAIAGLLLSTFVASCSKTPILARIEDEVELKDPSLLGSVHSLVVAAGDVDATVNDLFASNGRIYRRTDGSGDWNKVGLPASDIRCMNLATDGTNVYAREADDVEQIKSFAEQHNIPALLLAQLNKIGKGTQFANLDRTAIRGAGEKTEKANIVILLHRETRESTIVQVRIDKNTVGPTGSFEQYMDAPHFRVADIAA